MTSTIKIRRGRAQWQRLMALYEASEHSQQAFCREHGLALSTFAKWRRTLAETAGPAAPTPGASSALFTELTPPPPEGLGADTALWEVELELGAGAVLRLRRAVARC